MENIMENTGTQLQKEEIFKLLSGKLLMLINRYSQNRLKQVNVNITVEQWSVLTCLWEKDKVTQQALSDITRRDKASMTRLIDNLEKSHLVVRVPDSSDRRANLIYLTQKGIEAKKQASEVIGRAIEDIMKFISDDEIDFFRNILNRIMDNIN
ncbi:MAG: MarR family transcriptional regulator [Prevotellaceae bacterium]|jgi:DNA-binding MarR family transcriptional regulator|nr:MarR family transcriptional regulator [Prevotellaceae bacterium]